MCVCVYVCRYMFHRLRDWGGGGSVAPPTRTHNQEYMCISLSVCMYNALPVDDPEVARVLKGVHKVGHREEDAAQRLPVMSWYLFGGGDVLCISACRFITYNKRINAYVNLYQIRGARTQMSTFSSSCRRMYRSTISGARYICLFVLWWWWG